MAFLAIVKGAGGSDPQVLCQLRYDWKHYGLPGGGRKRGEKKWECAVREGHEESGAWVRDTNQVYQLSGSGNYWVTRWENCYLGRCSHPGEAKPFKKRIPDSESGPNNHRWMTRTHIKANMKRFAFNNGKMALKAIDYDFGVGEEPPRKRPRVTAGGMDELLQLAKRPGKRGAETWDDILARLPSGPVDERSGHTFTLLHHAAEQGQLKAVKSLVNAKADPNLKVSGKDLTARDLAKSKGHGDVVRVLDGLCR